MNGRLEQLSLAFEQGAVLLDHDDVTSVLSPSISVPSASTPSPQRVEDLATQLVGEALDSVYSSLEPGGIDMGWIDALFESFSGLTTTGATVITGIDHLPESILYYRQQLQWLGGMGIIVLAVAILPMLGIGGMHK